MTINLSTFLGTTFQGNTGIQGATGIQGFAGSQGSQGVQGLSNQGISGSQGETGIQGFAGSQGSQGVQGSGSQGAQGATGIQGNVGSQGIQGSGSQGAQGTQGTFGPATIPQNPETGPYTLLSTDNGQHVSVSGVGVTVPAGVFNTGENVVIYNNSAATIAITTATGGVTLRLAGTAQVGNRFLTQRGLATVLCVSSNEFAISGAGLT